MSAAIEKSVKEINLKELSQGRSYYPSPAAWEDEVLYFLLVDRFSDGKEANSDLFSLPDAGNINRNEWFENGKTWCGGNLKGLTDKLGYLKRLGITAVWISPVFKQTTGSNSYHGYGIQNFLDIDPAFGTREDLKELVAAAHRLGIRVILDIILNHAGNVYAYKNGDDYFYYNNESWEVAGFRKDEEDRKGALPFGEIDLTIFPDAWPGGAIWPKEFQSADNWTCKGQIRQWDNFPEFLEGDFFSLKDLNHGCSDANTEEWDVLKRIRTFSKTKTLGYLGEVYKFWIAFADIDGYRIDTIKHMEPGAVRYFTNVVHEFAQGLGKENFYLIGEITGGRSKAVELVDYTGLDAGLGIDDIQDKLEFLAKGYRTPFYKDPNEGTGYFNLFNNSLVDGKSSHQWFAKRVVTMFDDHDQVGTAHKFRYSGQADGSKTLPLALVINLTTLGIPCIYYGTEQAFNGADHRFNEDQPGFGEAFLRECMFGGGFGSFQSAGKHFFNEAHEIYQLISQLCSLRKEHIALRRGRQYVREVSSSGNENEFYYPALIGDELRWVIGWSRVFDSTEILCAINTNAKEDLAVWITLDADLSPIGANMQCILSSLTNEIGQIKAISNTGRRAALKIIVPAGGFVIYSNLQ